MKAFLVLRMQHVVVLLLLILVVNSWSVKCGVGTNMEKCGVGTNIWSECEVRTKNKKCAQCANLDTNLAKILWPTWMSKVATKESWEMRNPS